MSDRRVREVANETRSRELNEWIEDAAEAAPATSTTPYVCGCSDDGCIARIDLTRTEYEGVRAHSTRFAIALDHERSEIDVLIAEHIRFSVIRELPGRPSRLAIASDPSRPS